MPRIKGIKIQNLFGIEEMTIEVPEDSAGLIFAGDNGLGKTSILRAILAALNGQGIDDTAIRKGSNKGQALIDLDSYAVKRVLGVGAKLEVNTADGFGAAKPAALLRQMIGASSLDPLELIVEKDKKKRQKTVLQACPATITPEQLREYWPKCPEDYPCEGHALEVIARVHDSAYKKRTEANRAVKETAAEASRINAEAIAAADAAPPQEPTGIDALSEAADAATKAVEKLRSRQEQIAAQQRKTEPQLAKVQELRGKALLITTSLEEIDMAREGKLQQERDDAQRTVDRLAAELEAARTVRDNAQDALDIARDKRGKIEQRQAEASSLIKQADDIEAALAQAAVEPVSAEEMAMAERGAEQARQDLQAARSGKEAYDRAMAAAAAASKAQTVADAAKGEADRLDAIVKRLQEAPAEILAKAEGIPGLTVSGDDIFLDGVSLDTCCGAERIRFAVQIAKRANGKSKILIVDELERLSSKNFDLFVQEAISGDWELYGTRVSDDDHIVVLPVRRTAANDQAAE